MKTKLLCLILVIASVTMSAEGHMTFKGVELNGSLQEFVSKMETQGFTLKKYLDTANGAIMKGSFMGYSNCEIYIYTTPNSKIVRLVKVYLPEQENNWYSLKSDYTNSVEAFTNKYGKPKDQVNFFSKPFDEGDGYEMTGVKSEKCNFISFWELDKGIIIVEITKWCQVSIGYADRINTDLMKQEKEQNTYNDI